LSESYTTPPFVIILGMKLLAADVGGDLNYYSSMLPSTDNGFTAGFFGVVGAAH
jgi:hypothetical protein